MASAKYDINECGNNRTFDCSFSSVGQILGRALTVMLLLLLAPLLYAMNCDSNETLIQNELTKVCSHQHERMRKNKMVLRIYQ